MSSNKNKAAKTLAGLATVAALTGSVLASGLYVKTHKNNDILGDSKLTYTKNKNVFVKDLNVNSDDLELTLSANISNKEKNKYKFNKTIVGQNDYEGKIIVKIEAIKVFEVKSTKYFEISGFKKLDLTDFIKFNYDKKFKSKDKCQLYLDSLNKNDPNVYGKIKNDQIFILKEKPNKLDFVYLSAEVKGLNSDIFDVHFNYKFSGEIHDDKLVNNEAEIHIEKDITKTYSFTIDNTKENEEAKARQDLRDILNHYNELKTKVDSDKLKYNTFDSKYDELINSINEDIKRINELLSGSEPVKDKVVNETNVYQDRNNALNALNLKNLIASAKKYESKIDNLNDSKYKKDINGNVISKALDDEIASDENILKNQETSKYLDAINNLSNKFNEYKATLNNVLNEAKKLFKDNKATYQPVIERLKSYKTTHNTLTPAEQKVLDNFAKCEEIDANNDIFDINSTPTAAINSYNELVKSIANLTTEQAANKKNAEDKIKDQLTHFNELNQEITNLHDKLQSHISIDLEYKTLVNDFYTKSIDNNEKSILKNWLDEMDVYLGDKDSNKYLNALKNLEEIKTFVADYIVKLNTTKTKLDDATSSELIALANQLEIELKDKEATIDLKTTQASNYLNSSMSASNDFENYRNSQSALLAKNERKFAENKTLIIEFLNAENNSYTNKYLSEITNALALADKKLSDFHAIDPHSLYENNKTLEKELNFAGAYLDLLQNAKNDNKLENLFAPILASVLNQLKQNIAKFDSDVEQIKNDYAKELAKAKENANNKLKEINDLKDRYINQEQLDKFATGGEALSIVKDAIANNPMPNPNSATINDYNNFINKIDKALNDSKRQYDQSLAEAKNRLEELKNNLNNKKSSLVPPEAYPLSVVEIDKLIDKIDKNLKANPAKNLGELLIAEKEINEVDLNAIIEQDKVNLINNCKTIYNELIAQRENYNNHTAGTIGDAKYASDIQFKIEEVIKFVDAQGNNNETIIKTHIDLNPSYKDVNVNDIYIEYQLLANDKKHFEDSLKEYDVKWNKAKENLENKINEVQGSINSLVDPYKGRVSSLLTTIGTDLDKYNLTTLQDYYNQLQSKYEEAVQKSGAKAENLKIFNDKVKELNNKITECNDNDAPDYANTLVANETVKNLLEKAKQAATSASATATDIQNQSNEIDKLIKAIKDQYDKNLAIAIANLQQANSDLLVSRTKLTTDYATRINGAISANDLTNSDINNHSSLYYETYTLVGDNSNKHNPTTAISVKNLNNKIMDVNSEKNKLDSIYQTQVDVDKKYQQLFNDLQTKTNTLETKINTNNLNTINQISLALNELKTILSNILSIGNVTKSSGENELKDKYDDALKKYNLLVQTCDEQITNDKNILGDLIQKLNAKNNFVTTNNSTLKDIKNANGLKDFDSNFATFKNDYNNSTNHAKLQEDITKAKNYLTAFETEISKVEKSLLNNLKQALNDYQSFVDDTTQTKINNPKLSDVKDTILKNLNDKLEGISVPAKSVKTENDVDTNGPDVIESYINKINASLVEANNEVQNDLALIPPKISQLNVARNTLSDLVKYIEENNNSNTSADLTAAKELLTNTEENALINKNLSQINEYLDQSSKLIDALNKEKEALINNAKNGLAKAIDVATKIIIDLGNSADNGYKDLCDNLKDALNRAKAVYDNNTLTPNDYKNARSTLDSMCSYTTDNAGQLRKEQNNKIGELLNNLKAPNSAKTVITAIADESKKYGDLNNAHSNDTEYKNSAAIIAEGENKKDFKDYVIGTAPDTPKDLSAIVKKLEELQAYFNSLKSFYDDSWNKAKSNYLTSLSTIKKDLETIKNSSTENDDKYNVIEQKVNSITVNDESSLKAYEEANKTLVSASTDLQNYKNELNDTYTSINKIYENIKKLIATLTAEDTLASDLLKALNDELNSENINDTSVNENATQNKLEKLVIAKTFEAKLQNILDKHIKTYWNKIDSKLQSLQDSLKSNNVSNLGAKTIIDELNNTTKYAGIYTDELNELTARVNSENDKELKLKESLKQNQNINLLSSGISLKSLEAKENDVNTLNQSANGLKIKIEGTWNEAYASANAALQKLKDSKEKWSKGILYEPALGTDAQKIIDKYTSNPNDVTNNNQNKQFYDDKKDEIESTIVELLKREKTQRVDYKTKVDDYYKKLAFLRNKYKNLGNKFINVENHYKNNFPIYGASGASGNTKGIFELLTEAMTAGEVKQIEDSLKSFETSLKAEVKTSLESVQDELRTQYEAYKNARQTNNTELDLDNKNLYADQGDLASILKGILDEDSKIEKLITLQTSDPDQIKNVIDTLNQLKDNLSSWNNNHQKFAKNLSDKREEIKSQINIADSFISANQGKAYANELNTYLNAYKAEFNNNKWNLQLATDKLSELKSKIKIAQDAKDNENQTIDNIKKTIKKSLNDYQILINKEAVDQTLLIGKTFEVDQNQLDNYKAKNPTTVAEANALANEISTKYQNDLQTYESARKAIIAKYAKAYSDLKDYPLNDPQLTDIKDEITNDIANNDDYKEANKYEADKIEPDFMTYTKGSLTSLNAKVEKLINLKNQEDAKVKTYLTKINDALKDRYNLYNQIVALKESWISMKYDQFSSPLKDISKYLAKSENVISDPANTNNELSLSQVSTSKAKVQKDLDDFKALHASVLTNKQNNLKNLLNEIKSLQSTHSGFGDFDEVAKLAEQFVKNNNENTINSDNNIRHIDDLINEATILKENMNAKHSDIVDSYSTKYKDVIAKLNSLKTKAESYKNTDVYNEVQSLLTAQYKSQNALDLGTAWSKDKNSLDANTPSDIDGLYKLLSNNGVAIDAKLNEYIDVFEKNNQLISQLTIIRNNNENKLIKSDNMIDSTLADIDQSTLAKAKALNAKLNDCIIALVTNVKEDLNQKYNQISNIKNTWNADPALTDLNIKQFDTWKAKIDANVTKDNIIDYATATANPLIIEMNKNFAEAKAEVTNRNNLAKAGATNNKNNVDTLLNTINSNSIYTSDSNWANLKTEAEKIINKYNAIDVENTTPTPINQVASDLNNLATKLQQFIKSVNEAKNKVYEDLKALREAINNNSQSLSVYNTKGNFAVEIYNDKLGDFIKALNTRIQDYDALIAINKDSWTNTELTSAKKFLNEDKDLAANNAIKLNVLNDVVDKDTIHTIVPIDLNDVTNDKLEAAIASKDIEYKNKILELMDDQFVKNKDIHSLGNALKNPYGQIITDAKADTFFVDAASYINYEKNVKLLQNTLNSYSSYLVVPEYNTYLSTKEVEANNQSINDILARYQSAQNELDSINSATPVMPHHASDYQAYNANAKYFSKDKIDAKINSIDELYRNKVNDEIARLNNLKTLVETKWNNQNFNLNNVTNRITDLSNVVTKKAYEIKSVLDRDPNLYQNTLKDLYKDVQNKMNSIMANFDSLKNYKNEWAGVATWNNNVDIDLAKAERDKIVNYYNTNGIDTKYNIYKSQNNQPAIADCQNIIDFYNIVDAGNNQYKDIYANAKYDLLRKLTQGYYESNFYANKIKDYTQENMYKTNELYDLLIDNNNRGNKKALEEIKPIITNREVDKYNDMLVKYFNEKVDGGSFNQNSLLADNKDKIYDFVNKTSYIAELYNLNGTGSTAQEKEMLYNQSIQKYVSIKTVYNWINSQKDFNIKDALLANYIANACVKYRNAKDLGNDNGFGADKTLRNKFYDYSDPNMPSEFKTTPFMMYHPSGEDGVMHYTNFNSSNWYLLRDAANTPAQNQKYDYTKYANWNSNPDKRTFYIMRPFADLVYDFLNSKADQFAFVSNKFNIWDRFYDKETKTLAFEPLKYLRTLHMIEEHNKSANDVDIKTIAFDWNNKANVEYWGQKFNFKKVELPNDIKFMFQKYIPLMPDQNVFGAQTEMNVTVHLPINIIRWKIKETIAPTDDVDNSWYSRSASHKGQHLKLIIDNHNLSYMTALASQYILTNDGKKGDEYNMFKLQFHRLENSNDRNKMKNVIQWLIHKNRNKGYAKYFDISFVLLYDYLFYYRSIGGVNYGKDLFDIVTKTDSIKNTLTGYYNTLNGNATNIDLNDINNKINVEIQKLNDIYSNPNKTLHNYKPDRFTQDQGGSHITLDVGICEDIYNNVNDPNRNPEQFV